MRFILILLVLLLFSVSVSALPDFLIKDLRIERSDNKTLNYRWYDASIVEPNVKTLLKFDILNNGNESMDPVDVELTIIEKMHDLSQPTIHEEIITTPKLAPNQVQSYSKDITSYLVNPGMYQLRAGLSFSASLNEENYNNNADGGLIGVKSSNVDVGLFPNVLEAVKMTGGTGRGDNLAVELTVKLKEGSNVPVQAVTELWSNNAQFKQEITSFGLMNQGDVKKATVQFNNLPTTPEWVSVNLIPYADKDYTDNSLFWTVSELFDKKVVKTWSQTFCNMDVNCDSGENFIDCPFDCIDSDDLNYCLQSQSFLKYVKESDNVEFNAWYSNVTNKLEVTSLDVQNSKAKLVFNNQPVLLSKGVKQSLSHGEDILLVDLMKWNAFTKYALVCADGVVKPVSGVTGVKVSTDVDLRIETLYYSNLDVGKLPEQKQSLNLTVVVSNIGKADYDDVFNGKLVIKQVDFDGTEKVVVSDSLPYISSKETLDLIYEVSKSLTGKEREYKVSIFYDHDVNKNNNNKNFAAFGFASRIPKCGDLMCDVDLGEDYVGCAKDCLKSCGDKKCDIGEDKDKCAYDCSCGDNYCNPVVGENRNNCAQDCSQTAFCGDTICDSQLGEKVRTCPSDCKSKIGQNCASTNECNGEKLVSCWNNLCQSDIMALIMKLSSQTLAFFK